MRAKSVLFLLLLVPLFAVNGSNYIIRKNLHEGWKFKQVRGYNWYPASVPGVVHTDLLSNICSARGKRM
jgi:beta-mannosidase